MLEPVRGQHGHQRQRKNRAPISANDIVSAIGMEQLSRRTAQCVDGKISGDDDGDGVEDRAINVARGFQNDVVDLYSVPARSASSR